MVYESRVGDVFVLGASSWRIEDITADQVLVSSPPGPAGQAAVLARQRAGPSRRAGPRGSRHHAPGAQDTKRQECNDERKQMRCGESHHSPFLFGYATADDGFILPINSIHFAVCSDAKRSEPQCSCGSLPILFDLTGSGTLVLVRSHLSRESPFQED